MKKEINKKWIAIIVAIILFIGMNIALTLVNFKTLFAKMTWLDTFKSNLQWLENVADTYSMTLLFLLVAVIVIVSVCNFSISLNNVTFLGMEFSLRNPDKIVVSNLRNHLSTKRSMFYINEEHDNYCEVFDSYHKTYEFLREQLSMYESSSNKSSEIYSEIETMIKELNVFLTSYQSHFRKWMDWKEKDCTEYVDLPTLQREFPRYKEMIKEFKDLNEKMRNHANKFQINIDKWNNEKKSEDLRNDSK